MLNHLASGDAVVFQDSAESLSSDSMPGVNVKMPNNCTAIGKNIDLSLYPLRQHIIVDYQLKCMCKATQVRICSLSHSLHHVRSIVTDNEVNLLAAFKKR